MRFAGVAAINEDYYFYPFGRQRYVQVHEWVRVNVCSSV